MLNRQHNTHLQFESGLQIIACERCGKPATTVIELVDGTEEVKLCSECVKIVVRLRQLRDEVVMNKQERYNELVAKHEQEVEQGIVPDDAELSERVRLFYELDPERQHWKKYPVMSHYEPSDLWPES